MEQKITTAELIDICKALSNETRLAILTWLKHPEEHFPPNESHGERQCKTNGVCVGLICEKSGISQSTISHYLDMMQRAGLLIPTRRGKWTYYTRNEAKLQMLASFIGNEL